MEINDFNKQILNSKGFTIIDFWATWCGPCKIFGPIFEKVSKKIDDIKFYKMNVDQNKDIAKKYGVMSIPTIIFFKDGIEIKRNIGVLNEEELVNFIKFKN